MFQRHSFIVFISLCAILLLSACSSGATGSPTTAATTSLDGATLVQERCSVCHPLTRVESTRHSAAEWKLIVDTMIARGAQLNAQEETSVIDYLAANFGK